MLSLGLSTADLRLFEASLVTSHQIKTVVQILDLDHRYLADVSTRLIDGQVNCVFEDALTRSAQLTLIDPDAQIGFDTRSPSDNALYADRMIKIVYSVWSELLPRWVDVPLFCGPVTKVTRDDAILSVECQGKESLYGEPNMLWSAKTYPKGTRLVALVQDLMTRLGETKFDLEALTATTVRDFSLTPETVPWQFAKSLIGNTARQIFYDARGVLRVRTAPTTPSFTFTSAHLTSVPKLDYDHSAIRNTVLFKGATPEGKPQIVAKAYLPSTDPSSAMALGRAGKPRYLVEVVEDDAVNTQAAANARAVAELNLVKTSGVGFDFDSFPVPHLELCDWFHLNTREASINLRADQFAIPLRAGAQSNGTIRKLSANRARLRRT